MSGSAVSFLCLSALLVVSHACTNLLVTPGASTDGSSHIGYAADSGSLYGKLEVLPAADHPEGTLRAIYDWDSGAYLGTIPEANHTYNVVGNMNEFQLTIGETTFGGLDFGKQEKAVMDYGSLIWVTLQRARTAREAITTMDELVKAYGYASEGESFSIADPNEVWVLEMIGKGAGQLGAVWVAQRVPDGHVASHANQARIRTIPLNDPDTAQYATDVIQFARDQKLFNGTDDEFSFSDVFDPVTAISARVCEARVWSFFRTVTTGMEDYLSYVRGVNLTHRMPFSVPVTEKLSLNDTMWHMREHNEGSWFDNTQDVGAGPFHSPYRWRPLTWKYQNVSYLNERTIATQQTGWHFVSQARSWLPDAIGGIIWFSADDCATSVHVPMYCSITQTSPAWAHPPGDNTRNGDMTTFSFDSAFWVYNMVANLAYSRWSDVYPEVAKAIVEYEGEFFKAAAAADATAEALWAKGDTEGAVTYLTSFSYQAGESIVKSYLSLWGRLFAKYHDGQITVPSATSPGCGCEVKEVGYEQPWYDRIANETGTHYQQDQPNATETSAASHPVRSKLDLV